MNKKIYQEIEEITGLRSSEEDPQQVELEEVIGKLSKEVIAGLPLKPGHKAKLEAFVNNDYSPIKWKEFKALDKHKALLEVQLRHAYGLYDKEKDETYIIEDNINELEPWFKGVFGDEAADQISQYKDLITLHEKTHEAHYRNCKEFKQGAEEIEAKKERIIQDLNQLYEKLKIYRPFLSFELTPSFSRLISQSLRIENEIKRKENELKKMGLKIMASNTLAEGLAHWTVLQFCKRNPEYEEVGQIYRLQHLEDEENLLSPRNIGGVEIMEHNYIRKMFNKEKIIKGLLDQIPDLERSARIVQKIKRYSHKVPKLSSLYSL